MGQRHSSHSSDINLSEHFLEDWAASKRIDISFRTPFDSFDCRLLENQSSPQVIARRLAKITGDVIDVRARAIAKILARPESSAEKTGRIRSMTEAKKSKNPEAPKKESPSYNPYQSVRMRLKPKLPSSLFAHKVHVPRPSAQLINKILNKPGPDDQSEASQPNHDTTTSTGSLLYTHPAICTARNWDSAPPSRPSEGHEQDHQNDQEEDTSPKATSEQLKLHQAPSQLLNVPDLLKR